MSESADGSERRRAQRRHTRRRATDENSVEILESMSDGFAAVDREWRYTYVNRAAERNARLRRDEMLGRTLWEVFPEFAGSQFESACRRAMDEGVTVHFEEYCAPLDAWFEQTMYPAADGITVYVRDITERKRTEVLHKELLHRLVLAQEEERGRIAREMHDQLGQQFIVENPYRFLTTPQLFPARHLR